MPQPAEAAPADPDRQLGWPIAPAELAAWRESVKGGPAPARCTMKKLPHGGWTMLLPDGTPFMPVGIEYEPLAIYGTMDWRNIERDLDLLRDDGFNTLTVWCVDFNASGGVGARLSIDDMARLAALARDRGLFIQFYVNIDRFVRLFPFAKLADGSTHHFDIDYCDPGYLDFVRNFGTRLAMALYPYDNVATIVVWEEKIGLSADFRKDDVAITALFCSPAGKAAFGKWLKARHSTIENLNAAWGTAYASFQDAIDRTLLDYLHGVPDNDRRQHDVLEYGTVMLADFTRRFVEAYRAIDPAMLFQCRNWDLFGPVRAVHPAYGFLDSFGVNNYAWGDRGHDLSVRDEIAKLKLAAGITRIAPYVSNFGFRTASTDGTRHGLVPDEYVKAAMACDTVAAFSFIPEIAGTSYFTYFYRGQEGPWGIIKNVEGEPLPIYRGFKAVHELFAEKNREIARADYPEAPQVCLFHGLDAVFDLRQGAWIEHTAMSYDLTEMNINYRVVSDADDLSPEETPVVLAIFHAYDKKLDASLVRKLADYCRAGGALVIANGFGRFDRYLRPNQDLESVLRDLRGVQVSDVKRGKVSVSGKDLREMVLEDTYYVEAGADPGNGEVLLEMEVDGRKQPGLVRHPYGEGNVYYFLFNPCFQDWWGEAPEKANRTSLPVLRLLCKELGIEHDTAFGNRGLRLENGRMNIHEQPVHYFVSKDVAGIGTYADEYGEDAERYSGGVITDDFLSFRGRKMQEGPWRLNASRVTSVYAAVTSNGLMYCTADPVELTLETQHQRVHKTTLPYKVYRSWAEGAE